jgi:hypothetical protein
MELLHDTIKFVQVCEIYREIYNNKIEKRLYLAIFISVVNNN